MSSTANLQTDTLAVRPSYGDAPCPPPCGKHTVTVHASLTAAHHTDATAELLEWLDMFGLPPRERPLRTSVGERNRHGDYAKRSGE